MTAVAASPPSFHQPVPRSWTNGTASMHAQMTPDEVSRLLMPPRSKSQNAIPASQLSSTSPSTNPTSTTTNNNNNINPIAAAKQALNQLPPRPSSSASNSSSISSNSSAGTMPGSNATSTPASSNPSPNNSEPNTPINSANNTVNGGVAWAAAAGKRKTARNGVGSRESAMKNSGNASNALNAAISGNSNTDIIMYKNING
ncbi:hypothetical protein TWF703_003519 [Orbilia oligospora]|uniref:Uncharacterized protein n=1 Tax=Orbilia oligospora TaxID=2813651 RepID=A0A7C8NG47_ORBOL|nr:hypothetical protein TWF703_003519 [Orbilia oligospora]